MPVDLSDVLVVGISSRALFDLEEENRIFNQEGLAAYSKYQLLHEDDVLPKGTAFSLVQALLKLNAGRKVGLTRFRGPIRVQRSGSMKGVEDGQDRQALLA